MNFFKKQILGVDLGARTIKGVRLTRGKDGKVHLSGHFFQDLAQVSEDFPSRINRDEVLKASVEVQELSSSPAATTVRDSEVMAFSFNLPKMSEKELRQVVPQEVGEIARIPMDDQFCDYYVTNDKNDDPDVTLIKAFCVKRELVLAQMKLLEAAGLKPKSIESEMMAISAMLDFNGYVDPKETVVVLDLGESHLNSGLIAEGALSLTRTCDIGFGVVNQALKQKCALSYDEAEKLKLGYNFLSPDENAGTTGQVLDEAFMEVLKGIKELIEFYRDCPESFGKIDRILLLGGASQLQGIAQIHEIFFKIPTTVVNPFRNIDIFSSSVDQAHEEISLLAPYMGTAVGLALVGVPEGKKAA